MTGKVVFVEGKEVNMELSEWNEMSPAEQQWIRDNAWREVPWDEMTYDQQRQLQREHREQERAESRHADAEEGFRSLR